MRVSLGIVSVLVVFGLLSCSSASVSPNASVNWDTIAAVSEGTLLRQDSFESDYISTRAIDVWLPSNYRSDQKHAVLYMYDGQMLFDANSTWNHQEWRVDETLNRLILAGEVLPTIVVGLYNGGQQRNFEYFPQLPFEQLKSEFSDSLMLNVAQHYGADSTFPVQSDAYLSYVVKEVKPLVDANFSTNVARESTVIAGSSMGGLMSVYALGEYPEVFSTALCLSTHWPGGYAPNKEVPAVFQSYIASHIHDSLNMSVYFDYGTETLDQMYEPFQNQINEVLLENGFVEGENWRTVKFPGDEHNEESWANRLAIPLKFALKTNP